MSKNSSKQNFQHLNILINKVINFNFFMGNSTVQNTRSTSLAIVLSSFTFVSNILVSSDWM